MKGVNDFTIGDGAIECCFASGGKRHRGRRANFPFRFDAIFPLRIPSVAAVSQVFRMQAHVSAFVFVVVLHS